MKSPELVISIAKIFESINVAAFMRQFDGWMGYLSSVLKIDQQEGQVMYNHMLHLSLVQYNGIEKMDGDESTIEIGITTNPITSERISDYATSHITNPAWKIFCNILMIMLGEYTFRFMETHHAIWTLISDDPKLENKSVLFTQLNTSRENYDQFLDVCSTEIKKTKNDVKNRYMLMQNYILMGFQNKIHTVMATLQRYNDWKERQIQFERK